MITDWYAPWLGQIYWQMMSCTGSAICAEPRQTRPSHECAHWPGFLSGGQLAHSAV